MAEPISPVVPGLEPYEIIIGENQPQYTPLPVLRGRGPMYAMMSRWKPTDEERQMIANGADIYISQQTFGHSFQPTCVVIAGAEASGIVKELVIEQYGLNEELDERLRRL